jgi:iron complex transport system permease protein
MSAAHGARQRGLGVGLACLLLGALVALVPASMLIGASAELSLAQATRALGGWLGLSERLPGNLQTIAELRLWRALVAAAVGGGLSLSGTLLQGVFRNGLASPSVIGVSAGASLGAALSIALLGGLGPVWLAAGLWSTTPWIVVGGAFVGAAAVCALVLRLATVGGRLSVPTLLLVGIAVNTCIAGALAALQSLTLYHFEIARGILAWTFGTLDDRAFGHAALAWLALGIGVAACPLVARELDLFAGGEEDAEALGVDLARTKWLALGTAALTAAVATAVAGQISFVGLVVPHLLRSVVGHAHARLLPLSVLGGAVFLLGADVAQRAWLGDLALQPGILMSLIGGPFFLYLLWRERRSLVAW